MRPRCCFRCLTRLGMSIASAPGRRFRRDLASEGRAWRGRRERGVLEKYASDRGRSQVKTCSRQMRRYLRPGALGASSAAGLLAAALAVCGRRPALTPAPRWRRGLAAVEALRGPVALGHHLALVDPALDADAAER